MMATGHELAMALRRAYLAMHRRTDAALAAEGVTADQFVVLCALMDSEGVNQRELAARTSSDPNTLRAMLVLLERRTLIRRNHDPDDARARRVQLTPAGRAMFRRLWKCTEALRREMLESLSGPGAEALLTSLNGLSSELTSNTKLVRSARSAPAVRTR
jgi:DNA-binding MarR family transcriptional regulator